MDSIKLNDLDDGEDLIFGEDPAKPSGSNGAIGTSLFLVDGKLTDQRPEDISNERHVQINVWHAPAKKDHDDVTIFQPTINGEAYGDPFKVEGLIDINASVGEDIKAAYVARYASYLIPAEEPTKE